MVKKVAGGAAKTAEGKKRKVGSSFTKTIERGPNKGDKVKFKVAPSGKPFPTRILNDKGNNSTIKGSVPSGKKKTKKK